MIVPSKHIKTITRRLQYLEKVRDDDEANSYDLAEIAALRSALTAIEYMNEKERVNVDD